MSEDWRSALPEDLRDDPSLAQINDIATLAKTYKETKSMVGSRVAIPKEDAADTDWAEFYKRIGRPETPDDYQYEIPDDVKAVTKEDYAQIKKNLHEAGVNAKQAKKILDGFTTVVSSKEKASREAMATKLSEREALLKDTFGDKLTDKQAEAKRFIAGSMGAEIAEHLEATGMFQDPVYMRGLDRQMKAAKPDSGVPKGERGVGVDMDAARAEYAALLGGTHGTFKDALRNDSGPHGSMKKQAQARFKALQDIIYGE